MSQTDKLMSLFNIHPGEGRLVLLALGYAILLYVANVLARTVSYALFLAEFDAATLPYAYIGVAVLATLVTTIYLKLNERWPLSRVLIGVHVFLLLTLLGYWLGIGRGAGSWLLFSLPIYFGVNNTLTISSFWNLLGRLYNLQQAKRLFGLLSSGEHMATIATGFVAPVLVGWFGAPNLFLVAALVMAGTIALLLYIVRRQAEQMQEPGQEQTGGTKAKPAESLFKDPYVTLIIRLFALFILGIYFVDNIFYSQAELQYPTEDEMAAFIGVFFGVMGAISLFVQIFVAGRVLNRFGLRAIMLATPTGLLATTVLFALVGTFSAWQMALFWLATAAGLYRLVLDAVDSTASNLLYQPLPAQQRTQAQTTVAGIIYPLSIGLTGLILLFLIDGFNFGPVQFTAFS
ncbi:MAG: MFS transporter [Chloroflexota bacterium]